jgi:hypothetical protein
MVTLLKTANIAQLSHVLSWIESANIFLFKYKKTFFNFKVFVLFLRVQKVKFVSMGRRTSHYICIQLPGHLWNV